MVRRRQRVVPPELDQARALPEFHDDLSQPVPVRKAAWDAWMELYEAWRAETRAWYEAQGLEEPVNIWEPVPRIPPMPFDGSDV